MLPGLPSSRKVPDKSPAKENTPTIAAARVVISPEVMPSSAPAALPAAAPPPYAAAIIAAAAATVFIEMCQIRRAPTPLTAIAMVTAAHMACSLDM